MTANGRRCTSRTHNREDNNDIDGPNSNKTAKHERRHHRIAQVYAAKVRNLNAGLAAGRDPETLEAACALIDKVIIHPPETDADPPSLELVGDLMAMLQAGGAGPRPGTG